jgi:hypothetical protein
MSLILLNRGCGAIDVYVSTDLHVCRMDIYIYIYTHTHIYMRMCVCVWEGGGLRGG